MIVLLTALCLVTNSQEFDIWQDTERFFEGLVTRYEGSYTYPVNMCFNQTIQGVLTDDIIGIGTFASLQRWDQAQRMFNLFLGTLYSAFEGCQAIRVVDSAKDSLINTTKSQWTLRAYANSVLIYRYCTAAVTEFFQSDWRVRGQNIGSCLRYTLPALR